MEPILSNLSVGTTRNEPRDLQSCLYREIGISAVSAALQVASGDAPRRPTPRERRELLARSAA